MRNRITRRITIVFALLISGIIVATPTPAVASSGSDSVVVKALLQDLERCYSPLGAFVSNVNINDVTGLDSILKSPPANTQNLSIPNGLVGGVTSGQISCKELLSGVHGWFSSVSSGLLQNNVTIPSNLSSYDTKRDFLTTMGYQPAVGDSEQCVSFNYKVSVSDTGTQTSVSSNQLCAEVDSNGVIVSKLSAKTASGDSNVLSFDIVSNGNQVQLDCSVGLLGDGGCGSWSITQGTTKWEDLVQDIYTGKGGILDKRSSFKYEENTGTQVRTTQYSLDSSNPMTETGGSNGSVNFVLKMDDPASTIINQYLGTSQVSDITADETAQLYTTYLKNVYGVQGDNQVCGDLSADQIAAYTNDGYIPYRDGCYIKGKNTDKKVNGVENGKLTYESADFSSIVSWLQSYTGSVDVKPATTTATLKPEQQTSSSSSSSSSQGDKYEDSEFETAKCYDHAGPMGWVLCPIVSGLQNIMEKVYGWIETNYLQVNPSFFSGGESGLRGVWGIFRDIANIVFVILILAVIFSQVTGIGIDNYGIKKILPRIIIGAVLMNLSFIICMFLADLSNITGNGLNKMLSSNFGMESGVTVSGADATAGFFVGTATLATIVAVFFVNPGLIITTLIALLSAAIAILFLWVILVARQAAIILCVVISPLAFICYLLPNTEKWFKKWVSFMGGLLLLYPLCGLVIGGGRFAANVLASTGDLTSESSPLGLAALLVQVIPYFFIPTLFKSSLNVIGNLGTKISGVGKAVKSGTVGRFAKSDTRKRMQTAAGNFNPMGVRDKLANSQFGKITHLRTTRARQIATANKQKQEDLAAGSLLTGSINDRFERKHGAIGKDDMESMLGQALESGDEARFYAVTDDAIKRFGESKASQMFRKAITDGNGKGLMSDDRKAKFLRDSASRYGGFQSKDYVLGRYMQQGGGKRGLSLSEFEGETTNYDDIKDEQAATLNADSLYNMMQKGVITHEMAQRVMSNKELRRSMDNTQQLMWANHAEGGKTITKKQAEAYSRYMAAGGKSGNRAADNASHTTEKAQELTKAATYDNGHDVRDEIIISNDVRKRLSPLPEDVNVVGGSVGVSGGSVDVGRVNTVGAVESPVDTNVLGGNLNRVNTVGTVENPVDTNVVGGQLNRVNAVGVVENAVDTNVVGGNLDHVNTVGTVSNTVDVNVRDVNTQGAPQTQPLIVTHAPVTPPPQPPKIQVYSEGQATEFLRNRQNNSRPGGTNTNTNTPSNPTPPNHP